MSSEPAAYNPHHHPGLKFYRNALTALHDAGIPFVVGGAYAYSHYVSIARETKDFDIFIHPHDVERALGSIKVPLLYMPSETDLYFPIGDARYEAAFIPGVTLTPIPSLWGHTAGAASNPADAKFLNENIGRFLSRR